MANTLTIASCENIPQEPCECCQHKKYCKTNKTACYLFATYCGQRGGFTTTVYREIPRLPCKAIYRKIFPNEEF